MKALGWWLMLVGSLRLLFFRFGFFDIWALRLAVFSNTTMTEVHGRTFGVWTLLTCTHCFLCAFNLENKPLYLVTFLSFIYAFGHFLTEYLFYHTMALSNLTTFFYYINYMDVVTVECTSANTCQACLKMNLFTFICFNLIGDSLTPGFLSMDFMFSMSTLIGIVYLLELLSDRLAKNSEHPECAIPF